MATKHTPGPWEIETVGDERQIAAFESNGNRSLCIRVQSHNTEADARLIAAAPRMFSALKCLLDFIRVDNLKMHPDALQIALTAIAAAKGEA
jgi:hypothetical protein